MRRIGLFAAVCAVALVGAASFAAAANSWQGTWTYYNAEGAVIGGWTAGCGSDDKRWGDTSGSNKRFSQGCASQE